MKIKSETQKPLPPSVDELFPDWTNAKEVLRSKLEKINWILTQEGSSVFVNIINGDELIEDVPDRYKQEVISKVDRLCQDYVPNFAEFEYELLTQVTLGKMKEMAIAHEAYIVSMGGRSIREEFAFRFGLLRFWGPISFSGGN